MTNTNNGFPIFALPTYTLTLPSDKTKVVKYRPYTVKEEKLLLIAAESGERNDILNATRDVVFNCILENHDINLATLPVFDVDYMFIIMRARSVGSKIAIDFTCDNQVGDDVGLKTACGNKFKVDLNIDEVKVRYPENVINPIKVGENYTVKMKYPAFDTQRSVNEKDTSIEATIKILTASIDYIFDSKTNKNYSHKDYETKYFTEFVESLDKVAFDSLKAFIDNMPTFDIRVEKRCDKCGFEHKFVFDDLTDFF